MPTRKNAPKRSGGSLVTRIEVDDLFHTYSYRLELTPTPEPYSGKLMLLYGNNGSGKTTILNLLYHLLHPEPYGSHRSFVGSIPFKMFRVHLLDGLVVTASRSRHSEIGGYEVTVEDAKRRIDIKWQWRSKQTRPERGVDAEYEKFCSFLRDLGFSFHYLRDTRRVEGTRVSDRQAALRRRLLISHEQALSLEGIEDEQELFSPDQLLTASLESFMQWFRQHALLATNVGYTSVNTIYRDIIKRIVAAGTSPDETHHSDKAGLVRELLGLKEKNRVFAQLGLTPELDVKDIITDLKSAKPRHLSMLNTVLRPYLEGHAARLDALNELQQVINSFVALLSSFYSHKKATVHLEKGLSLRADTGQELDPANLSSGEKQLLLLFCNAISSRQNKTVLMIDEPEISLNVRWQRELIPALLTCMSGTAFQIVIATHSVELLARYRDCVTPLHSNQEIDLHE